MFSIRKALQFNLLYYSKNRNNYILLYLIYGIPGLKYKSCNKYTRALRNITPIYNELCKHKTTVYIFPGVVQNDKNIVSTPICLLAYNVKIYVNREKKSG